MKILSYLNRAGNACNSSLISSTFPFSDAALSAAAAATAILLKLEQEQAVAAKHALARAQTAVQATAARRTPEAPPRAQRIAQAALPRTQHAPTMRPEVKTWKMEKGTLI